MIHAVYILLIFLAIYLSFILPSWHTICSGKNFLNINIVELFSPIIQILVAVVIAILINIKLPKRAKKNEVLISMFDDLIEVVLEINKYIFIYYDDMENIENQQKIKSNFKQASQKLSSIKKIADTLKMNIDNLNTMPDKLRKYKRKVTDDPFGQKKDYSISEKQEIDFWNNKIIEEINLAKIKIYDY